MRVVADTSVWIAYLRGAEREDADKLERLLARRSVLVCGPIVAELLAGASTDDRESLWQALSPLAWVDVGRGMWRDAGELASELQGRGTRVPLLDLLIAVATVSADAALWTRDRDFELVRSVLPSLRLYAVRE